jgi:alpha-galactosidase
VLPDDPRYATVHLPHGRPAPDELTSEWISVIWARAAGPRAGGGRGLLAGFVSAADQLCEVRLRADAEAFRSLEATCYADGILLEPGQSLRSERLLLDAGDDPLALLESYADRLGELMRARPARPAPTGWCTWYYFFGECTERQVLENLAEIRREGLPLDYVIVDDGYQHAIGDWLTLNQEKYQDMGRLAQSIRADGRRAGLWVAPFGLGADSATFAAHPDWIVRDDAGQPVVAWQHFGQDVYALDLTHPDVPPWLEATFRTMREQWGYEFFKVDFLFAACAPGRRHDPHVTRAQALRRGLEVIRRAIGDDAFLLGCGAPQMPCVGMVDGMRVGPDVAANWHPFWPDLSSPAAENALRNSIARYFTHGRLWINDPDCVLVRERGDSSDLVLNEMRALAGIVALLGGATISSDNLPSLRRGRFKYLAQILPPTGTSARPLDLFENELPQCLVLPVRRPWGAWHVVGVMNWQDRTQATEVDLRALGLPAGRYHVFNYWPRNYMGVADQFVTIDRHQPHELVILLFKPAAEQPDLLTTTFHVAQTLSEVVSVQQMVGKSGGARLEVILERAGGQSGELWFTFPASMKVQNALVDGRRRKVSSDNVGVAHLGLTLNGRVQVTLEFGPAGEE